MRTVPEWIGSSPDAKVPPRVKLRIFERAGGRCHISGRLIRAGEKWELEHIVAICNGGAHSENNLAPALAVPHRKKTREDVAEKAVTYRKRAKHIGIKSTRRKIASRGFVKASAQHTATRPLVHRTTAAADRAERSSDT